MIRRSELNFDSRSKRIKLPDLREDEVRNTAVVCCIAFCIERRREAPEEFPEEEIIAKRSRMESRPISDGEVWCGSEGEWLEEMWMAVARP